ncbi:hypothetical protein HDU91_001542 [Kappamyces sp. JEL0680]|nr:hypothetical protein HDU91_001542 [Kappamyces sp. JEL0680]
MTMAAIGMHTVAVVFLAGMLCHTYTKVCPLARGAGCPQVRHPEARSTLEQPSKADRCKTTQPLLSQRQGSLALTALLSVLSLSGGYAFVVASLLQTDQVTSNALGAALVQLSTSLVCCYFYLTLLLADQVVDLKLAAALRDAPLSNAKKFMKKWREMSGHDTASSIQIDSSVLEIPPRLRANNGSSGSTMFRHGKTPNDRAAAFEEFKEGHPIALRQIELKEKLKTTHHEAKKLGEQARAFKDKISK